MLETSKYCKDIICHHCHPHHHDDQQRHTTCKTTHVKTQTNTEVVQPIGPFLDLSKPVGPARYFLGRLAATNPRQQNTTNIYEYLPEYLWTSEFESEIFRTSNLRWPFELSIEHPYLLGWHWVCNPLRSCWKGWLVHHPITLHRPELSGASQHHLESSGPL